MKNCIRVLCPQRRVGKEGRIPRPCTSIWKPWRPSPNGAPASRRTCARTTCTPSGNRTSPITASWLPALALTFHRADGHTGPVGFAANLRALHWGTYLETHARRCYGVAHDGEADTARRILARIRKGLSCWWNWGTWRRGRSRHAGG